MKLVMTLVCGDDPDILDAQIAFHLNAGVDFVLASCREPEAAGVAERYADRRYLRLTCEKGPAATSDWRSRMARVAVIELGADWLLDCDANEFWWPRASSLKDVLAPIPASYTAVQGLVRRFLPRPSAGGFFADEMTVRRDLRVSTEAADPYGPSLVPLHRVRPDIRFESIGDHVPYDSLMPLRGWYPIEVFRFPGRGTEAVEEDRIELGLAEGSLVVDVRLSVALRALRAPRSTGQDGSRFTLPDEATSRFDFPVPNVVDDAAYAVDCAALGEGNLGLLERRIEQLEAEIASVEGWPWRRVVARASRLGRKARRAESA